MRSRLATLLASSALLAAPAVSGGFGDYAHETLEVLVFDHPGRFTGSTVFPEASDYMATRLGFGGDQVTRQEFDTSRGPSHNLLVQMPGQSDDFIVVGAHFDTAGSFEDLQGVDDNGSGAAVLTELAAHMSGLETDTGLVFAGFGAEEIGLLGSRHYVETMTGAERGNIAGMINIDSLITGDFMYAHAGTNHLDNPDLKSFWTRIHAIADELDIELKSNPGLNPHYPADTGCCSDAAPFQDLDIPVLWLEATNWELGDLDGYQQTDNPAIPGGMTWHDPELDRWDVLTAAFGEDRIPDRLHDYALLLTRLLVEETGADLIASAADAARGAALMGDLVIRQQNELADRMAQGARARLAQPGEIGRLTPTIAVQGLALPRDSSTFATDGGSALSVFAGGFYQLDENLSFGATITSQHSGDDPEAGGDMEARGVGVGLDMAWQRDAVWAVASASFAKTGLSGTRSFAMTSGLGTEILRRDFDFDTDAYSLGARVEGGYDFTTPGGLRYGPVLGLDYNRTRITGFGESGSDRRAMHFDEQDFESLELHLGGQVSQQMELSGRSVTLSARAAYVRELADGRADRITLTDSLGTQREQALVGADDSFGRIGLSAEMQLAPDASGWVFMDGRVGHDAGSQLAIGAGLGMRF